MCVCVFTFVCVHVHLWEVIYAHVSVCIQSPGGYTFTCMCAHVESRGKPQCPFPGLHLFTLFFGSSLSLPPGSHWLGWLAGQRAPVLGSQAHVTTPGILGSRGWNSVSCCPPALPRLSSLKPPTPFVFLLSPVPLLPSCFPH